MNIIYLIDFNCPYSYIGLERLKKCCEKLNIDAEWEMKAFELEPSAGKRPEKSTAERYREKHGTKIGIQKMQANKPARKKQNPSPLSFLRGKHTHNIQ